MQENTELTLHPNFTYRIDIVGEEQQPVLVVDNFLADPQSLIDYCANHPKFNDADYFYPGLRMPAPKLYPKVLFFALSKVMQSVFNITQNRIQKGRADFSMVVTPPSQLKLEQCLPHCDSINRADLACVHYLCNEDMGGTSFYRHQQTGFEYVDDTRQERYQAALNTQVKNRILPKRYTNGSNELFTQTASYESVFNRLIMYRGSSFHSGNIAENFNFETNPRLGRLTLNTFFYCSAPD